MDVAGPAGAGSEHITMGSAQPITAARRHRRSDLREGRRAGLDQPGDAAVDRTAIDERRTNIADPSNLEVLGRESIDGQSVYHVRVLDPKAATQRLMAQLPTTGLIPKDMGLCSQGSRSTSISTRLADRSRASNIRSRGSATGKRSLT